MAPDDARRRRDGALGIVGAVTMGAVAATFISPPAQADNPGFPSWADVQAAKADKAAAEAEGTRITTLLSALQDRADASGRTAEIASERFHRAKLAEDAARQQHAALAAQADKAAAVARTSRMRAGLLAASVARGGGGDLQLMLDASGADDFLHRLATVSQLSAQAQDITRRAVADENEATALGAQADAAATVLAQRADAAKAALDSAQQAVDDAGKAVAAEQKNADRLVAQLAVLRGTSARVAAQYAAGVRALQAENAQPYRPSGTSPSVPSGGAAASGGGSSTSSSGSSSPSTPVGGPSGPGSGQTPSTGTAATPDPVAPAPVASAPASAGAPNTAQAASAVAFARDQIGDPYRFAGAGPNSWDCSGLTMMAYASVGIAIGGHSATAQYDLAKSEGKLVPYSQAQVGDLIFYTDGGGDMYHVAVYSGSGMMIEAPYAGVPVREVPVRSYERVSQVARPTAASS
ncbi:MAG: C40 family peptidase [Acidobacteria bacterium]|nr:C40 family peptidase [Acidobacteriota bacterium]